MMISEKYQQKIIVECRELDSIYGNSNDFEELALEIDDDPSNKTSLTIIKKLGDLSKKNPSKKLREKQNEIFRDLCFLIGAAQLEQSIETIKNEEEYTLPELQAQLDKLVGLDNVKKQVKNLIIYNKIQQLRIEEGLKKPHKTMHMAFLGNPGTAKTTVARIVGRMYKEIGLLSKGQFIEASRTDLIAEYQGQTARKVKQLIKRAQGGVLFIDEAYSITENDHVDSYGKECLTELTKALEDFRDDLVVIVAGYPELMEQFFNSNPGLKSRFNSFIYFDDYSVEELVKIFNFICMQNDYKIETMALEKVHRWAETKLDKEKKSNSNGRMMRNLFDDVIMNQAKRLTNYGDELTKEMLILIKESDIPSINN